MRRHYSWGGILYIIVGIIVASNRGYFVNLANIGNLLSALIAIVLWPLLIFGISLHITL
jgi:hypothetical protein